MKKFLCISVRFLTHTYHGVKEEGEREWPPSPARLFQALVAGAKLGIHLRRWEETKKALEWLEKMVPPRIIYPEGKPMEEYSSYAFSNQLDRLREEQLLQLAQQLHLPPSRFAVPPKKEGNHWTGYLDSIPHQPTLLLGYLPCVHYLWEIREEDEKFAKILCEVAGWIISLGWGTDLAVGEGRILEEAEAERLQGQRLIPLGVGKDRFSTLRRKFVQVPKAGFLSRVLELFEERAEERSSPSRRRLYSGEVSEPYPYQDLSESWGPVRWYIGFELFWLYEERMKAFTVWRWKEVVGWVRHAIAKKLGENTPWVIENILGHGEENKHICFVPVPSIPFAGKWADGMIRRVMLVGEDWEVRKRIEDRLRRESADIELVENGGRPVARIRMAEKNSYIEKFARASKVWISVSPVVLHGHDYRHGKFSLTKTQHLILQAFEESGYHPTGIARMWFQKAPLFPGTFHVSEYAVPAHLARWPRYHVGVEFKNPVHGPVLVGIGQHYGLGLLAPARELDVEGREYLTQISGVG